MAERTAKDYAIEHAVYLANAADRFLAALRENGGVAGKTPELCERISAEWSGFERLLYEFRKRADKAEETTDPLDQAWNSINALGGRCGEYDDFGRGINHAVEQALFIIEELGGMDPLQCNLDPRTPEYGVGS